MHADAWFLLARQHRCRCVSGSVCGCCNTPGVCHQLSNGFELKHGMLSGDEGVKIKSTSVSSNLNLGNTPLLAYWPFSDIYLSNVEGASFMCLTSISTHMDDWKSFIKFGIKKSHEMISYNLSRFALLGE